MLRKRKRLGAESNDTDKLVFEPSDSNLEFIGWHWPVMSGCQNDCTYCNAKDQPVIFFHEQLEAIHNTPINSNNGHIRNHNVLVCPDSELFGPWVSSEWINQVLDAVRQSPKWWNYLFLTKFPERLSEFDFPDNSWLGVSVDCQEHVQPAEQAFYGLDAPLKYVCVEPLQEPIHFNDLSLFDWLIIGSLSGTKSVKGRQPEWEWIESLLRQARQANVKIYFKANVVARPKEYPGQV